VIVLIVLLLGFGNNYEVDSLLSKSASNFSFWQRSPLYRLRLFDPKWIAGSKTMSKQCAKPVNLPIRAPHCPWLTTRRFIVCSNFSQEKHIFFEQIKPTCVIRRSAESR
jgi:hypothetical protein